MTANGNAFQRQKAARELACLLAFARAYWLMQSARRAHDTKAGARKRAHHDYRS